MKQLGFFSLLLAILLPLHAEVTLIDNGKPMAEIVLAPDATPSVKTAAGELQHHLEAMSGVKLPMVEKASPEVKTQVFVGESEGTRKLGVSVEDIKADGFKIIAGDDHVVVAGPQSYYFARAFAQFKDVARKDRQGTWEEIIGHRWRFPPIFDSRDHSEELGFHVGDGTGTLYGVYALLEQLGFRWYAPMADLGIVTPELKTIAIKEQNTVREPEFPVRTLADVKAGNSRDEMLWQKSMGVGNAEPMRAYHSVSGPTKLYPAEQPQEYYGKLNGKVEYSVPKLSNERLRADMVEYLEWVDKVFPGSNYVGIGQPDGWSLMDDEDVAAGWDKVVERGNYGRFSDYSWDFSMDVRKRVMEKYPDKKFTVFAYSNTRRPPSDLEKVPENVTVIYCQTSALWMLPNNEKKEREEWIAKMANPERQLLIWEYYLQHAPNYNFPPVPVVFTGLMQENFSGLYDNAIGFLCEIGWSARVPPVADNEPNMARPWISHLMLYLHNKLCWDRELDVQATLEEYYRLFYGPAQAEMKEFYEFAEQVWTRPEARQITAAGGFLKQEDVDKYFDILSRAKTAAGESIYGQRIDAIMAEMEPLKLLFEKLKREGPSLKILATAAEPTIDGDLEEPFWRENEYTFHDMHEMNTGEEPQHVRTSVSFRWLNDNSALIIGIECMEPRMDQLREATKEPDSPTIYGDDFVQIRLETAGGIQPLIVVNPAGTVLDECVTTRLEDLPAFYKVGDVAVKKHADRWTVEVRVDAAPIGGERPTPFYPWGANVSRQRMAGNVAEHYMLSPSGTNFNDWKYMANIFVRK